MTDQPKTHSTDRRLADIVREVKIASADRTDVVVDIRDADRARLDSFLATEIRRCFTNDIDPADRPGSISGISPGPVQAANVASMRWRMCIWAHDRRVFPALRSADTRLGAG